MPDRSTARTPSDQTAIQRQIDATDRQIDQLVYEFYGLTADEIRIVVEATTTPSGLSTTPKPAMPGGIRRKPRLDSL